jgi:hypothetical protein
MAALPCWRSCGSFINFSIGCHDSDRVVVLSTFLLAAMMATANMAANRKVDNTTTRSPSWQPIEKLIKLPRDRHHGSQ